MKRFAFLALLGLMSLTIFQASASSPTPEEQYWSLMKQAIKKAHDLKWTDAEWRVNVRESYKSSLNESSAKGQIIQLIRQATDVSRQTTLKKIEEYTDPCIANCKKKYAKCVSECTSPTIGCAQECSYNIYDPCVAQCPTDYS